MILGILLKISQTEILTANYSLLLILRHPETVHKEQINRKEQITIKK